MYIKDTQSLVIWALSILHLERNILVHLRMCGHKLGRDFKRNTSYWNTVWKLRNFALTIVYQKFREINVKHVLQASFTKYFQVLVNFFSHFVKYIHRQNTMCAINKLLFQLGFAKRFYSSSILFIRVFECQDTKGVIFFREIKVVLFIDNLIYFCV